MFNSNRFRQRIAELESESARQQAVLQAIDRSMARVEFGLDCRIVASNENFQRLLGYSAEQLIGKEHRELCDPALVASPLYRQHWDKLQAGQPFSGRVKRLRADGTPVWLEATYNPIKDTSGRVTGFVKFAADVTRQVQEAMRDKAVLAAIDRSMAMIEFTPDGIITSANDNFLRTMGYAAGDLIGKHHRILCTPAFVDSADYAALWRTLQGGQFFAGLVERVARDGSPRWLEASYNPVVDESGKVLAVIKTASDITARIQQQQEVRESVQLAFDTSQQTRQWANDGVGYITDSLDAVNSMARAIEQAGSDVRSLGEHSQQIGGIVQTIKDIADQTNLLALNAAIEAARAGEQGRGFAVVADEVRKLAERTSSSTDEISRMVGDIHQQTGTAVESMENIQSQATQSVEHFSKASEVMTQIRGGADAVVETVERVVNLRS